MNFYDRHGWARGYESTPDRDGDEEDQYEALNRQELEKKYPLGPLGNYAWNFLFVVDMNKRADEYANDARNAGEMSREEAEDFRKDAMVNLDDFYKEVLDHAEEERQALPDNCSLRSAEEWRLHKMESTLEEGAKLFEAGLPSQDLPDTADAPDGGLAQSQLQDDMNALEPEQRAAILEQMYEEGRIDEDDFQNLLSELGR